MINGLIMRRNLSTIGVCPFPAKLVTHNSVVALNGHLMMRNGPTIGVW